MNYTRRKNTSIEDYWVDAILYHVEFITLDKRKISKDLIFPIEMTEDKIISYVKKNFSKVKEIKSLEYMYEVMCSKNIFN